MRKILLIATAVVLAGCSGARQLYSQADTAVEHAKVILIHHNAIGEQVASLREDPDVREETKANLEAAYRGTVCSTDERSLNVPTPDCREGVMQVLQDSAEALESVTSATNEIELEIALRSAVSALEVVINALRR